MQAIVAHALRDLPRRGADAAGIHGGAQGIAAGHAGAIVANAPKINEQAVVTKTMPIGNLTQMTNAERAVLAAWIAAGAPAK